MMQQTRERHSSYDPINKVKDIPTEVIHKLAQESVRYMQQIFVRCQTEQQRAELAHKLAISVHVLDDLVCYADLMRLHGVGSDLARLLQAADVQSCQQLQQCDPEELYKQLARLHISRSIAYHAPTLTQVRSWINEAHEICTTSR